MNSTLAAKDKQPRLDPSQDVPPQLAKLDVERRTAYDQNLRFYQGQQWDGHPGKGERRVTLNYTKAFVKKTVAYLLHGRSVGVEPREKHSAEQVAIARNAENVLRDLQALNDVDSIDYAAEVDAAVFGDGAFKITWSPDDQAPIISCPDVRELWWWHDWRNPLELAGVAHMYRPGPALAAATSDSPPAIALAAAASRDGYVTEVWSPTTIEYWAGTSQLVATEPNTWGKIPYVIFPNVRSSMSTPWGESDVVDLKEPAQEINRGWTQLSRIMELSGNPVAVLEGVTDQDGVQIGPGEVWTLPKDAKAYLLELLSKGGGEVHLAFLNRAQQHLHDVGESPRTAWGDNSRMLSGRALEMELDPLGKLIARKRAIRAAAYRRRDELLLLGMAKFAPSTLSSLGVPGVDAIGRITYQWGEVLKTDRSQTVADEVALVGAGIHSRQGASGILGDADPEGEWKRALAERSQEGDANDGTTDPGI